MLRGQEGLSAIIEGWIVFVAVSHHLDIDLCIHFMG